MGRGSLYQYKNYMLVDDEGWEDVEGDMFRESVFDVFDLSIVDESPDGREAYYFGEMNDVDVMIGMDMSGGFPALFAELKYPEVEDFWLDPDEIEEEDRVQFEVDKENALDEVEKCFNQMIEMYEGVFRKPTSSWTSEVLTEYVVNK